MLSQCVPAWYASDCLSIRKSNCVANFICQTYIMHAIGSYRINMSHCEFSCGILLVMCVRHHTNDFRWTLVLLWVVGLFFLVALRTLPLAQVLEWEISINLSSNTNVTAAAAAAAGEVSIASQPEVIGHYFRNLWWQKKIWIMNDACDIKMQKSCRWFDEIEWRSMGRTILSEIVINNTWWCTIHTID